MNKFTLFLFVAVILFLSVQAAFGCSCIVDPNKPEVDYGQWAKDFKGIAFSGRVAKIEPFGEYEVKVTFKVDKFWRGADTTQAIIYTAKDSGLCGVTYDEGKEYIVITEATGDRYVTYLCPDVEYVTHRAEYLKALGQGFTPADRPAQKAVKFQEFGNINCETALAYLDALATQIQNDPNSMAYVIIYGGRKGKRNEAKARLARMMHYWVVTRRMDGERFKRIDGGYRETLAGEIWLATPDDAAPKPTPTVDAKKVKLRGTEKVRGYNCGSEMGL